VVKPRVVLPELQNKLLSIDAYRWFTTTLQTTHDCCLLRSSVPDKFAIGIDYLVKQGILILECNLEVEAVEAVETEEAEKKEMNQKSSSPVLFFARWHAAKVATARVLVCMERVQRAAPPPTFDEKRLEGGVALNEDEQQFLALVRANPIVVLEGAFGCGKTQFVALLDKLRIPSAKMQVLAFTGNAVENIASRITCARSTMHAFKQQQQHAERTVHVDLTAVDEASMVTELLFMETIAVLQTKRLVLVGDPAQIPAFGAYRGNLLSELLRAYPSQKLTRNYRQERDPSNLIVANAQRVRDGVTKLVLGHASFYMRPNYETCRKSIMLHAAATRFHEFQWVTALNEHSRELNLECVLLLRELDKTEWFAQAKADAEADMHDDTTDAPPPPPPPVNQLAQHLINWTAQRPDAILNTFWPGDRILCSEKVLRSQYDAIDERFNQMHYIRTGQLDLPIRTLCVNGTHDEIEWIRLLSNDKMDEEALAAAPCLPFVTRAQYRFATPFSQTFRLAPLAVNAAAAAPSTAKARPIPEWMQHRDDQLRMRQQQFTQDSLVILKLKSGRYIRLSDVFAHGYAETAGKTQGREYNHVRGENMCFALASLLSLAYFPPPPLPPRGASRALSMRFTH
jgi:hypothetical protein